MMVSMYMHPRGWPSTLVWMTLSSLSEATLLSYSCFSSSTCTRATSLPRLGHSKTQQSLLHRKLEYFFGASSFLHFHLSLEGLSFLGDLSRSPLPLPLPPVFLPCPFEDSLLNLMSDSMAAIAKAKSCTPRLSSSILAHPHRPSRKWCLPSGPRQWCLLPQSKHRASKRNC